MSPSKSKIVFLDSTTVDFGGVNIAQIKKLGNYTSHKLTEQNEIVKRVAGAAIVITNKCVFNKDIITQLPHLKMICVCATGVNNVDLKTAKAKGIAVSNVAGYSTTSVAEHTMMFILSLSHRLMEHHTDSVSGLWSQSSHFSLLDYPFVELKEKTLGIIGYGTIGRQVAKMAKAFGMEVIKAKLPGRKYKKSDQRLSLKQVLQKGDFVSLHCALTRDTHHLINKQTLTLMKPSAYLLNLARGPIVNEEDIAQALKKGQLAGYATDVMEREPPKEDHPFFQTSLRKKVLITPHVAWASRESRQRLIDEIGKNIEAFLNGRKRNRVV